MRRELPSLLESVGTQDLLPGILGELECAGEFTAARLFAVRPDAYRTAGILLAEGYGINRIAEILHLHTNTVMAVRDREGVAIEAERERLASRALVAARGAFERVIEDLDDDQKMDKTSVKDKALVAGIMVDKGLLLAGEATQRIEHIHSDKDEFSDFINSLKSVAEDVPAMDLADGAAAQKGLPAGDEAGSQAGKKAEAGAEVTDAQCPGGTSASDTVSEVSGHNPKDFGGVM